MLHVILYNIIVIFNISIFIYFLNYICYFYIYYKNKKFNYIYFHIINFTDENIIGFITRMTLTWFIIKYYVRVIFSHAWKKKYFIFINIKN